MQRFRRLTLPGLIIGLLLLVALPGSALAHANLADSRPGSGETVGSPPGEVWTKFTEELQNGTLEVYDPCGTRVDDGNPRVILDEMTVGMSADKAGAYVVRWRVLSVDGHTTAGEFSFASSGGSACAGGGSSGGGDTGGGSDGGNKGSSGSSGSSGDGTGGSTGGSASSQDPQQADGTDASTGDGKKPGKGKKKVKGGHGAHHDHGKGGKNKDKREIELAGGPSAAPPTDPKDIPTDWLLISLAISALIGAAGGRVYVNIFGGVRRSR